MSRKETALIAELIEPGDSRWCHALRQVPHDFYHLPEYAAFSASHEEGRAVAFYAETDDTIFLLPMLLRRLPAELQPAGDWVDAASPYGYPGPIASSPTNDSALRQCMGAFREVCEQQDIVSAFVRLHPTLGPRPDTLRDFGQLVEHGEVVLLDLTVSEEDSWRQTRSNHRRGIRKLETAGFRVVMEI